MKKNAASEKESMNKINRSVKNKSAEELKDQIVGKVANKNEKEKEKKKEKEPGRVYNYFRGIVTEGIKTAVKEITDDEEARKRVKVLITEVGDDIVRPYVWELKKYAIATGTTILTVMQLKKLGLGPKCMKTIRKTIRKYW
ncbi:hypothetical protein AQUCO_02600023v1 [Aquilegia coerulea]|uniref:Uncharacterized protein n=1 Tax=Aquilegia coerulea TaxID=218851 RepID=A0A2G5D6Z2_AQUCA|nr:hypothetical protein AQUCO_02600023v1 [Aquilegia coerulea]